MSAGPLRSLARARTPSDHRLPSPGNVRDLDPHPDLRAAGNLSVQQLFRSGAIQAKVAVSAPGDPAEAEADGVADRVVAGGHAGVIQRKAAALAPTAPACVECGAEEKVQRKGHPGPAAPASSASPAKLKLPGGSGQPLAPTVQALFEPRFGTDFSGVRVHAGEHAAQAARSIEARAFTAGRDVVFGADEYHPEHREGQRLIAHELTHVVQQQDRSRPYMLQRQGKPAATPAPLVVAPDANAPKVQRDGGDPEAGPLIDRYRAALTAANWERAAVLLNGFSDDDIKKRVEDTIELPVSSRTLMRQHTPDWDFRVRRALLLRDYEDAKLANQWGSAATTLNGFSDEDIRKLASQLSATEVGPMITGARESMSGVSLSRVLNGIARRYDEVSPDPPGTKALTVVDLMKAAGLPIETTRAYLALKLGVGAGQGPAAGGQASGDDHEADVKTLAGAMGAAVVAGAPKPLPPKQLEEGNLAHELIGDFYCALNPPSVSDLSILDVLGFAKRRVPGLSKAIKQTQTDLFTNLDMRPDIVDLGKLQLFEIKPLGSAGLAVPEALLYISLFNALGLSEISFKLGNPSNPGTAGMIPGPQQTLVWASPLPGAIIYNFVNPVTDNPRRIQERIQNGDLLGKGLGIGVEATVGLGFGLTAGVVVGVEGALGLAAAFQVSPAVLASFESLIPVLVRAVRLAGQALPNLSKAAL